MVTIVGSNSSGMSISSISSSRSVSSIVSSISGSNKHRNSILAVAIEVLIVILLSGLVSSNWY